MGGCESERAGGCKPERAGGCEPEREDQVRYPSWFPVVLWSCALLPQAEFQGYVLSAVPEPCALFRDGEPFRIARIHMLARKRAILAKVVARVRQKLPVLARMAEASQPHRAFLQVSAMRNICLYSFEHHLDIPEGLFFQNGTRTDVDS